MNSQNFHTESLILRPVDVRDYENVLKWENNSANWIQSGITEPYSNEEIKAYVSKVEDLEKDGQTRLMIDLKNNETIGCVDLFDYDHENGIASVGLLIDGMHRGNGYGSEALLGIGLMAKEQYQLQRLKALILADNDVSIHLFKKNGFKADDTKATIYHYNNRDYLQLAYFKDL